MSVNVIGFQQMQAELKKALAEFMGDNKAVTVGIHEEAGDANDQLTMASLGAIQEYGASINHPGGTSYGYATASAARHGKVRFLKTGVGYMQLGVTGPHKIEIPARPWLKPGVESGTPEYLGIIQNRVSGGAGMDAVLEEIGIVASGKVQQYMTDLKSPPNAKSTIAKKGSSNPLIADGHLRSSVTYAMQKNVPNEGLE
ncbi:hypothetical protein phiPLPE_42 [Iodobacter phage PhiPLPE]|uniref:Neck protein n=1 Tax=Iodobacter phage PhiPLPE TaxID=551895 RepID=B5AX61_9CAUD|nr:tail completion or Neck1 protein [Iodobacter phage PhiPLPE]ACG60364.1 hypothetical protein phiPLPE_42 [Iodobacter phage PhiPLPE]